MSTPFPFILTFCRPNHKPSELKGLQVYAVVSDGFHDCRITSWPRLGLPFPMNRRTLSIRVFAASNEAAFERGSCEEIAMTFIPLWRIPEVCLHSNEQGLSEIWLSLDTPCPTRLKDACLDAGGEVHVEVEAELLGIFESSRELAVANPTGPRICVIVQARSEASSARAHIGRPGAATLSSSAPIGTSLPQSFGEEVLATGGLSAKLPTLSTSRSAAFQTPIAPGSVGEEGSGGSPTAAAQKTPECSSASAPDMGKLNNSEGFWRARWEEERQRHEDMRKKYAKQLQAAKAVVSKKDRMLLQAAAVLEARTMRRFKSSALEAWISWISEEQRQRQFMEVTDEDQKFRKLRDEQMSLLSGQRKDIDGQCQKYDSLLQCASVRRATGLNIVEKVWGRDYRSSLCMRFFTAWHRFAVCTVAHQRLCGEYYFAMQREWWCFIVHTWRCQVGVHRLEEVCARLHDGEVALPRSARDASGIRVSQVLDWSGDTSIHKLLCAVLLAWSYAACEKARLRDHVFRVYDSSFQSRAGEALVIACMMMWRGCLCRTEAALAEARSSNIQHMARCRTRAAVAVEEALASSDFQIVQPFLLSWHFHVCRGKLQRSLEQSFTDQLEDSGKCELYKKELEDVQYSLSIEKNTWDDERSRCQEDLLFEESQVKSIRIEYKDALEQRKRLEKQHSDAASRSQELAKELVHTESETVRAREQWQGVLDASEFAKQEALSCEEACTERLESAKLEILKLQAEDAKLQGRRERDVRDLSSRLRTQVQRQEEAVQRLERSAKDDHAMWEQKVRQSEARSAKLENDVQITRRTLQSLPSKAADIEAENVELLAAAKEAEERLRQADEAERRRRSELARLRNTLAELQRMEELDWQGVQATNMQES